ncbi:GntR family transcriptional regulator [Thermoflavimicrobium daqui]|uniref:GntR family transcriptional regulator n=1 Tax=Thermoflavimicrobium daqui TaxID=2137476 RepID=A0A364K9E7_9BACL|nr:GntR family transcriptional regulator [Thermoflavimicrobium daqui]RAL26927.1 GntR family transcriptional regulator [Thermoflavimicrobium daqui]
MLIEIDLESDLPIYSQLVNQIIEGIATGHLKPGEGLPSVRTLAADLGINLHTVNKAYQILKQKGFVLIHRQKGVVIQPQGIAKADAYFIEGIKETVKPLVAESICRDISEEEFITYCRELFSYFHKQKGGFSNE